MTQSSSCSGRYEVPIFGKQGMTVGLFRVSSLYGEMAPGDRYLRRIWRGVPSPRHTEKLVLTKDFHGKLGFGLLIEEPDGHWMKPYSIERAAEWLAREEYEPFIPTSPSKGAQTRVSVRFYQQFRNPLSGMQRRIWDALAGRALTASQLVLELGLEAKQDGTIRKYIQRIRKAGHPIEQHRESGYYRPDAPPLCRDN